jgi:hypothetical protein
MIELKEAKDIYTKVEKHFAVIINDKEVWINRYYEWDSEFGISEGDIEIFKGEENLTEEEKEQVIEFIESID